MDVVDHVAFRVTRNADLTVEEEEADDLLAAIEMELRRRRFGKAVRLEVEDDISARGARAHRRRARADRRRRGAPRRARGPERSVHAVRHRPSRPQVPRLRAGDAAPPRPARGGREAPTSSPPSPRAPILLHHPYDSFVSSVEEFIRQASVDPKVLAIKLTLYRTSGDSPIVGVADPRRRARQAGRGARRAQGPLRRGAQHRVGPAPRAGRRARRVRHGRVSRPTPRRAWWSARKAPVSRRYCHIGTGNYNSKTARLYEDFGLLTADPAIGVRPDPPVQLPDRLLPQRPLPEAARRPPPRSYRSRRADPQRAVRARRGRATSSMKMNSLVDPELIEELYAASRRRRTGRSDRPRHLLPASPGSGPVREHHGAEPRRPLPRALPPLPVRERLRAGAGRCTSSARPT